jgi:hypothetical protein
MLASGQCKNWFVYCILQQVVTYIDIGVFERLLAVERCFVEYREERN